MELDLNFYCTVLYCIATMLHLTALPRGRLVASSMYHINFMKTENIAVNKIGEFYVHIYLHVLIHIFI